MSVEALDHVNVITDRLDETADFYATLLGLERRDAPAPMTPQNAAWMYDGEGRAIIHINSVDCPRAYDREVQPGAPTGALHHVALRCRGYDRMVERLDSLGADYQARPPGAGGRRQIFTADPNNVLLELNFFGE